MRRTTLTILTLTILVVVLAVDMRYKIVGKTQLLLSYPELSILALIMFVGAGERIEKFAMGKGWLEIEQNVDKQAIEAEKDAATLVSISKDYKPDSVDQLLSRYNWADQGHLVSHGRI